MAWQRLTERGHGDRVKSSCSSSRFSPPSLDEVKAHVKQKEYNFDPVAFLSYYKTNGWKVGKNPMKCWHSACVTWQTRSGDDKPKDKHSWAKIVTILK